MNDPVSPSTRLASIDIFRGLTMAVMIFVNDMDGVRGLPWWTHHAEGNVDAMTYVDMVFPFFLFAIGLSLPLAVRSRLARNPSLPALWLHVLARSLSLLALGVLFANADDGSAALMHLNSNAWALLGILGMALFLGVGVNRYVQFGGLALALAMLAIYRRITPGGHSAWLSFDYLEILGIIGCTYFAVAALYLLTRRLRWAPMAWFVALVVFSGFCAAHRVNIARSLPLFVWPVGDGTLAFVAMAGVITSALFTAPDRPMRRKLVLGACFGIALLIAGWLFTPLGISKIRETPTWGLYSSAAAVLIFTGLYWLCDAKRRTAWAAFVRPAGANTLLTYLLPDILYFLLGLLDISLYGHHFNAGLPGVLRSLVFTAVMLALSGLLLKRRVRLQL